MRGHLFGTDGVRGVALEPPLDRDTVTRLGVALGAHLRAAGLRPRVLLAGDTRASTPVLAEWAGGALRAAGGEVVWAGVLPTPAISHLVREDGGFGAGLIVSASHNPARDNGIKLVNSAGTKWPVAEERALEKRVQESSGPIRISPLPAIDRGMTARYLDRLVTTLPSGALAGVRVVVDAANGAAAPCAAPFFERLGARVELIHAKPDGQNINLRCGALHPKELARHVVRVGADAGVALDGDADRAILVAHTGRVLDGDDVLIVWGRALAARGDLPGRCIVATVMSNLGLQVAAERERMRLVRCPVGDREVWENMEREGAALGGEQSGHVICSHHAVTGDGMLTAAHVLAVARARAQTLDAIADLEHFPQVLVNVRVAARRPIEEVPALSAAIAESEARLHGYGRVFVRYSGTEPLLRIMVEAPTPDDAQTAADSIAGVARSALGVADA